MDMLVPESAVRMIVRSRFVASQVQLISYLRVQLCGRPAEGNAGLLDVVENADGFLTPNKMGLSCTYMASYAQDLRDRCSHLREYEYISVGGQAWDTDGYNINVHRQKC